MDPLTLASNRFQSEVLLCWNPPPGHATAGPRVLRLAVPPSSRADAVKSLRVLEWAPDNRRPFLIVEEPFVTLEQYLGAFAQRMEADHRKLAEGLAEEGVVLTPLPEIPRPVELAALVRALVAFATSLQPTLDGLLLVLMPARVQAAEDLAHLLRALASTSDRDTLRVAVQDQPGLEREYAGVASFHVDEAALLRFLKEMGTDQRRSKGPGASAAASASPATRKALEAKLGTPVMSQATGIDLRALLLDAGSAMSEGAFKVAARRFRAARMLCHLAGLKELEAAISVAVGSALLATGDEMAAIAAYRQGKALALACSNNLLAAQAELGVAGVRFFGGKYAEARASYREIQALAAEMPPLRLEAMRMEGECHLAEARPAEAIHALSEVVAIAEKLPLQVRRTTSYAHAGKSLAAALNEHGQTSRARATEKRLAMLAAEDA